MTNWALVLFTCTFLVAHPLLAQTPDNPGRPLTYQFNSSVPISACSFDGEPLDNAQLHSPIGAQFSYIGEETVRETPTRPARTVVVFQFLTWEGQPEMFNTFNAVSTHPAAPRKTFCVDKRHFDRTTTRTYASGPSSWDLAAGILLLPIKMRLGGNDRDFDFSRDVTLGTVVGPRWRLSPTRDAFLSILGGAGITAVTLDAASTQGAVTQTTDRAAVTLTGGLMLEINRFQMGLLLGGDRISNPNQTDWQYQGKPWISLGLGYSLLSAPPTNPATSQ